ncbi:MAG: tetratricopeptide repeat protein [Acidobacteriota bacterium]
MPATRQSEELFQQGLRLLEMNHLDQAATMFEEALKLDQQEGSEAAPRLLSYCGYTLAFARKKYLDGLKLCKMAVEKEFFNPDLFCNLGDIYLSRGDKKRAHKAFRRGLSINPQHAKIRSRIQEMGERKGNIISFLSRTHFLNELLGKLFRAGD